jgi:hypothetical protein
MNVISVFFGAMDVNRGVFGRVVWVKVTFTETALNAVGFTVLMYFCCSTTCEVRRCTYFVLLPVHSRLSDLNLMQ